MTQVCAQRNHAATEGVSFPSKSSDKVYKVTAYRPNEFPFCSCPSYIFGRSKKAKEMQAEGIDIHQNEVPGSCKHLEQVLRDVCDWRQEADSDYQYDGLCPKCAGPVVEEGETELPDDPVHAVDDLRAMLADLAGEEAPAPLPKAEPYVVEFTTTIVQTRRLTVEALDDGSGTQVTEAWKAAIAGHDPLTGPPGELTGESSSSAFGNAWKADDAPKVKKPRKAAAKKAAPARGRQVDVTGLVQGAQA